MSFDIDLGVCSLQGRRARNEDCAGIQRAPAHEAAERGLIAALADGVSGREASDGQGSQGLMAAQTTVLGLLADFHATPAHWDTGVALERLLSHQNAWLAAHNRRTDTGQALCTLTALALQGRRYCLAHVGDSRAWLLREGQLLQLTQDHRLPQRDFAGLTRALGLDDALRLDHGQGELRPGDRLLLSSDGVHGALRATEIARLLRDAEGAQAAAETLTRAALAAGSPDNCTALVLLIRDLAAPGLGDLLARAATLPCPGALAVGASLDGLTVTAVVADNGLRRLLQVRDADGALYALKTLHPSRAHDPAERAQLAHEIWLGLRLAAAPRQRRGTDTGDGAFVRLHERAETTQCYALFDWHSGQTLEQLLKAQGRLEPAEVLALAGALSRALSLLHAARCVHRDIKPANLHRDADGRWRLLDLGVALSPRSPVALRGLHAGTPSYINPEQWDDPPAPPDAGSDLYALGVTLYQALTGRLPYGELEPYQDSRLRREPPAVSRLQPGVPIWLDRLVAKAIARDPRERFETADELLLALERGAARGLPASPAPRAPRDPLLLWQLGLGLSLLFNLLLVTWLLALPRG